MEAILARQEIVRLIAGMLSNAGHGDKEITFTLNQQESVINIRAIIIGDENQSNKEIVFQILEEEATETRLTKYMNYHIGELERSSR